MPITKDNTAGVLREVDRLTSVGLKEITSDVVSTAKMLVVVKTGDLQRSIDGKITGNKAIIGSPLDYAAKIERDNPYLRPALEANTTTIRRVFKII